MMDARAAKNILQKSDLTDGEPTLKLASTGAKPLRRSLIKRDRASEDGRVAAAIEIQRVYRGYCTRCRLLNVVEPNVSKTAVFSDSKPQLSRLRDVSTPSAPPGGHKPTGRERLEQYYQSYVNRLLGMGVPANSPQIISFEDFCANYIQNWWSKQRKRLQQSQKASGESTSGRTASPSVGKIKRIGPPSVEEAAAIIQRAWRKHIDIQVFRYYRDLINFRQRGDPALMLRCINPNEAKMLDAAMGIHIKFRLAGDRFPPNIYYKIFTHRPIQDLCANSPKDYTRAGAKLSMARDVHNKGDRVPRKQQKVGWYERLENNGWRLVSDRLIHHALSDPVTWETSNKKVNFHHNKLQRRDDVERNKKKKKIEWMQKMYKQGMLRAKVDDKETVALIEGAAAGMVATVDSRGPDAIADWEVDELLDWTTSLNFEDYWCGWKEMATSGNSENPAEERLKFHPTPSDPYEFTFGGQNGRRAGSTRQSHNTPVSSHSAGSIHYRY